MDRGARRRRIETLDPTVDHREITRLFYLDFQSVPLLQAVTGDLMTFAVPRMSRMLDATGQFTRHTGRRLLDTTLLVSAVLENGLSPAPAGMPPAASTTCTATTTSTPTTSWPSAATSP